MKQIFENYYITENGRVFNKKKKLLKFNKNNSGYTRFTIFRNGKIKHMFLHITLVRQFGDCTGNTKTTGYDIHHIDGNKNNNKRENLLICTRKQHRLFERTRFNA